MREFYFCLHIGFANFICKGQNQSNPGPQSQADRPRPGGVNLPSLIILSLLSIQLINYRKMLIYVKNNKILILCIYVLYLLIRPNHSF